MKKQNIQRTFIFFAAHLILGTAVWAQKQGKPEMAGRSASAKALAVIHPTTGNNVQGTVVFTQEGNQVRVVADIGGLTPGKHGFHIHEWGDCGAPDGSGAGDHFSPNDNPHGAPTDAKNHAGDLGNLEAGADGKARLELTVPKLKLDGQGSVIGRAVIIHAQADDLKSQPAGNAGSRVACGVIGVAKP